MKIRFAPMFASVLCLGLLGACDQAETDEIEREALFHLDDEPIYDLDDVPEEAAAMLDLFEDNAEALTAPGRDDGLQFRATCKADCGDTMMSISGDICICHDNVGCFSGTDGDAWGVSCNGDIIQG